jgi:hypothetical protein
MTLPNTPNPSGQAVPTPPKDDGGSGGPLAGLWQWLGDSYNGLYKIVLEPSMPTRYSVALLVVGLIIGLIWGYSIAPATFSGANPNRLSTSAQEQWIRMVAIGSDANQLYPPDQAADLASRVPNPDGIIERVLQDTSVDGKEKEALRNLQSIITSQQIPAAEAINPPGIISELLSGWLVPAILAIVIFPILVVVWRLLIYPNIVAVAIDQVKAMRDPEFRKEREEAKKAIIRMREEATAREQLKTESAASSAELGPPVMTQLSIYSQGRAYDESFEIELESGEFLGQSGAVIAEAVDPDPVAIEVWLFDIFTSKTIAKVFITPQGNNDPAIRSRIEASVDNPATDIIVANPNSELMIESDKLRLQAKLAAVDFNANGRFDNFRLQLLTWQKGAASVSAGQAIPPPAPTGAPPMSAYDDIQFDPPPPAAAPPMSAYDDIQFDPPPIPSGGTQPTQPYIPPAGNVQPLQPPPLNIPPPPSSDDDDDPFGGTGDFTPLGD